MKLVLLDYLEYELFIEDMDDELKSRGDREKKLDRKEAMPRIYRVLSILLSANHSKQESGMVSYERNKNDNRNPYLLCDGNLIYETKLTDMPILLHTTAYDVLFDSKMLATMQLYGLIEKMPLADKNLQKVQAMGLGTKHYYKFTKAAQILIPETPEWVDVNQETSEFMTQYFIKKNRLGDDLYIHLIEMLTEFEFKPPKFNVFIKKHKDEYKDHKLHNRTPEDLMKQNFKRMQNFNQYERDQLLCNSSSCEEKWSGRFYSPITSLSKYCRQYLMHIETQSHLVELDIQTCQYHMINCVLRKLFGNGCTGNLHTHLSTGMNVYSEIAKKMYKTSSPTKKQTDRAKKAAFERLFSGFEDPNAPYNRDKNLPRAFRESYRAISILYPDLIIAVDQLKEMEPEGFENTLTWRDQLDASHDEDPYYIFKIKGDNDHRKVSFCATCMEVQVMKNVWRRLNDTGIVYLTMHDAVYVIPDEQTEAKGLFEQALKDELGYIPTVRSELMDGTK